MTKRLGVAIVLVISLFLPVVQAKTTTAETTNNNNVVISEIKLNDSTSPEQFVEFFNPADQVIDLSGWTLEYAKYSFPAESCSAQSWKTFYPTTTTVSEFELTGSIGAKSVTVFEPPAGKINKTTGGSLRLLSPKIGELRVQHDLVGWGNSGFPASCKEGTQAVIPSNTKSIQRYLECGGAVIDTEDNGADFAPNQTPTPGVLGNANKQLCSEPPEEHEESIDDPSPTIPELTCEGVVINEILPNPAGSDTGHEFIELYNPTNEVIPLKGCSLQTTASTKVFNFPDDTQLQSGEYHTFSDSQTGLTLSNASGGTVWLLSPTQELQAITYPGNLEDDTSSALIDEAWQTTYQPTPGAANVLVAVKPCPAGQVRNQETNRCQTVATLAAATLAPCKEGQERNPETNRCRSIVGATDSLVSCKPGQARNPETNRCRSAETAAATLKPCDEGEERNPETNRCRKVSTAGSNGATLAAVKDVNNGSSITNNPRWWLAGVAAVGALGYGAYEWRRDLANGIGRLKGKFLHRTSQ